VRLTAIALRAVFAYCFLLLILRVAGKRTLGQATPIDFVAALILGDFIDDALWGEVPAAQFVVAAGVLMLTHVLTRLAGALNPAMGRLIHGMPVELVRNGALQRAGMRRERVNRLEVAGLLREISITDQREVERGLLESSGQLSVRPHSWAKEAQKQDLERVREARR
jgi:uncharacterized membrane protein YcaP (DUF421 family)